MVLTLHIPELSDASQIQRIYAPYVKGSFITFEDTPPSVVEMERRLRHALPFYPWVVAKMDQTMAGYAYASQYRSRAAYRWSVEVTVYVDSSFFRKKIGHRLYRALLSILQHQGYNTALACIALPNPSSVGLHESLGFTQLGVYHQVGFKLGQWVDTGWWELKLQNPPLSPEPPPPKPLTAIPNLPALLEQAQT